MMNTQLLLSILLLPCGHGFADDWPQFRGPLRDGVSRETGLLKSWPSGGPKRLWLASTLGAGYSAPAIVAGKLFIMGQRDDAQWLLCLGANDGRELWATRLGATYTNDFGDGPRGTPTVAGGSVFALGANGELLCVSAADGKEQWRVKLADFGGKIPAWGYSESPLVDGDRVVVTPGGEKGGVVALEAKTGKLIWQSNYPIEETQYTSLIRHTKDGVKQYICVDREKMTGLAATDGKVLWQEKFRSGVVVAQMPIVSGDLIYATSGGGTGCKLVKLLKPDETEIVYADKIMKNLPGGVVLHNGHVFGYSDARGWICQDFLTGEAVWDYEDPGFRKGPLTIADGKLICVDEVSGTVVLAEASTKAWTELSRFTPAPQSTRRATSGKVWSIPVVSAGRLYLRDQEQLWCFYIAGG